MVVGRVGAHAAHYVSADRLWLVVGPRALQLSLLDRSRAEHVRRPAVPAESPTLGFTHLQFEALLTPARHSAHPCDFALVAMLGLLGLRIFEATGADIRPG